MELHPQSESCVEGTASQEIKQNQLMSLSDQRTLVCNGQMQVNCVTKTGKFLLSPQLLLNFTLKYFLPTTYVFAEIRFE